LKILIVDDDWNILEYLKNIFIHSGMEVIIADNGFDALQYIREQQIDLVLTDIAMPDMDGYELYTQIMDYDDTIPVIMMTGFGYDPNHVVVRAKKDGLHDVVFKPFDPDKLILLIKKRIEHRKRINNVIKLKSNYHNKIWIS